MSDIKRLEKKIMEKKKGPTVHSEFGDSGVEIEYEKIHIRPKGTPSPGSAYHRRRLRPLERASQKKLGSNFELELNRVGKLKNFHHDDREVMKTYLDEPSMNDRPRMKQDKYLEQRRSKENREIVGGDQESAVHRKKPRRHKLVDIPRRRRRRQLLSENDFASVGECEERRGNKLHWHYVSRSNKKRKKRRRKTPTSL